MALPLSVFPYGYFRYIPPWSLPKPYSFWNHQSGLSPGTRSTPPTDPNKHVPQVLQFSLHLAWPPRVAPQHLPCVSVELQVMNISIPIPLWSFVKSSDTQELYLTNINKVTTAYNLMFQKCLLFFLLKLYIFRFFLAMYLRNKLLS